jgi:hypothetical protein
LQRWRLRLRRRLLLLLLLLLLDVWLPTQRVCSWGLRAAACPAGEQGVNNLHQRCLVVPQRPLALRLGRLRGGGWRGAVVAALLEKLL